MLTKAEFVECAEVLRNYWNWENELEDKGIYLNESAAGGLADTMLNLLTQDDEDWGYDSRIGMNWVVIWCSAPHEQVGFARGGQWITIETAGALYDFVCEMVELDWPKEVANKEWLK